MPWKEQLRDSRSYQKTASFAARGDSDGDGARGARRARARRARPRGAGAVCPARCPTPHARRPGRREGRSDSSDAAAGCGRAAPRARIPLLRLSYRYALLAVRAFWHAAWDTSPGTLPRRLEALLDELALFVRPERRP